LVFIFDKDITDFEVKVQVVSWDFTSLVTQNRKLDVEAALAPFVAEEVPYARIMKRPLHSFDNLASDIVSLVHRMELIDAEQNLLYKEDGSLSLSEKVVSLLSTLALHLGLTETSDCIKQHLPQYLNAKSELSIGLDNFLRKGGMETCRLTDNSKLIQFLKCCTRDILVPCIINLRNQFYSKFPYRDVKGTWSTKAEIGPNEIKIVHSKQEQSKSDSIDMYFTFSWELQLFFDGLLQDCKIHFRVLDISFPQAASKNQQFQMQKVLRDYIHMSGGFDSSVVSMPISEVVQAIRDSLRQLPQAPPVNHPKLKDITIWHLLECLDRTLTYSDQASTPVLVPIQKLQEQSLPSPKSTAKK